MFPLPYYLDFDEGAAHVAAPRMTFPRNANGLTPLELARQHRQTDAVALLTSAEKQL